MALRTRLTAGVPLSGWVPWWLLREFLGPDHFIGEGPRKIHQLFGCLDMCLIGALAGVSAITQPSPHLITEIP